jgi:hypothetical protein
VDPIRRWREPAAFAALGALAINIGLAGAALLMGVRLVEAAPRVSGSGLHALLLIIVAALAASCMLVDRTRHAGLIAGLGIVLAVVTIGWIAAYTVTTWLRVGFASVPDVLALAVTLMPPALALSLLIVLLRRPSGHPASLPDQAPAQAAPAEPAPAPPDPALQPAWPPDVATGAAWRTAGDAAAGAPASGWTSTPEADERHAWWGAGDSPEAGPTGPSGRIGDQRPDQEQRRDEGPPG